MLEKLSQIDWHKVKVVEGGDSTRIPGALKGLLSHDEDMRRKSYWQLDNCVVVQSDLYEAAWYVIPFLLEILSSPTINGRSEVYDLLYEIGNGSAPFECKIETSKGDVLSLQAACRKEIISGLDIYIDELRNAYSPTRKKALDLIASLDEAHELIIDKLHTLLREEQDVVVRSELQQFLYLLSEK